MCNGTEKCKQWTWRCQYCGFAKFSACVFTKRWSYDLGICDICREMGLYMRTPRWCLGIFPPCAFTVRGSFPMLCCSCDNWLSQLAEWMNDFTIRFHCDCKDYSRHFNHWDSQKSLSNSWRVLLLGRVKTSKSIVLHSQSGTKFNCFSPTPMLSFSHDSNILLLNYHGFQGDFITSYCHCWWAHW